MSVLLSVNQIGLARHALGLDGHVADRRRVRTTYRNHYVVDEGCQDYDDWMLMVAIGAARRRGASQLTGGAPVFWLTREGAEAVLRPRERLDPEDFPPIAAGMSEARRR